MNYKLKVIALIIFMVGKIINKLMRVEKKLVRAYNRLSRPKLKRG